MKNILLYFFLILWTFTCFPKEAYSQGKKMLAPHIYQNSDTWCWSACMEMVMKFHWPGTVNPSFTVSQSKLIQRYVELQGNTAHTVPCTTCVGVFAVKNINQHPHDPCYYPIDFANPLLPDYLDRVFSSYNFRSRQVQNKDKSLVNWTDIVQQINNCRPFIIFVNPASGLGATSDHALVVKGYTENSGGKYIYTNDPWFPCTSPNKNTIFPYSIFLPSHTASPTYPINKVWSAVLDIYPDSIFVDRNNCNSCEILTNIYTNLISPSRPFSEDEPLEASILRSRGNIGGNDFVQPDTSSKEELDLLNLVKSRPGLTLGFDNNFISQSLLDSFLRQDNYYGAKVKYLSTYKLSKCLLFKPKKLNKLLYHNEEVMDIISGPVGFNIVSSVQKNKDGFWELRRISNYTSLQKEIRVKEKSPLNPLITLKNPPAGDTTAATTPYYLVKNPPFHYEFFAYETQGGETNMVAAGDYPALKLEYGIAYPEKDIIKRLSRKAKDYYWANKQQIKFNYKNAKSKNPFDRLFGADSKSK